MRVAELAGDARVCVCVCVCMYVCVCFFLYFINMISDFTRKKKERKKQINQKGNRLKPFHCQHFVILGVQPFKEQSQEKVDLTPKLPTCSRTKARCEHDNIISGFYVA